MNLRVERGLWKGLEEGREKRNKIINSKNKIGK